ncbi:MAG: TonB family protein [Candidatus Sulfotelmatobacter sp.]
MGYVALLFCPDEKTARTVTQVLSELEFSVEACLEPFAAVKKLMGEHFDAVVVDCDNEQNATLLFKSARNSTSNQTSLAVAVVEGQAGVAKAFRIGANLVLTKPINIEQAKGTLRVARGLLRKADPAKPGAPAVAAAPSAPAPAAATPKPAPKPVMAAKPVAPAAPKPAATAPPVAKQIPVPKPAVSAPAWPAAAAATSAVPTVQGGDLVEKPAAKVVPAAIPEPAAPKPEPVLPKVEKVPEATAPVAHHVPSPISFSSAGAASAPAPAREPQVHSTVEVPAKPAEPAVSEPASAAASALMFSYGGSAEPASSGGKKKIFIGVAAAVVIAGAAYFGWTQYQAHSAGSASTQAPDAQTATVTQPAVAQPPTPTSVTPAAAPAENVNKTSTANAGTENSEPVSKESAPKETAHPAPSTKPSASSTTSKPAAAEKQEEQPEPAPLMVKSGKEPAQPKSAAADVSAPSMIGMATPASAPPPELVPSTTSDFTPKLQAMNISQGVSQGLLYKKVSPVYPPAAMRMRTEGAVQLIATISKNGDITHVKALSGDTLLTKAAVDAVKQWKYKPYLLNGEPVEIQTQVTINFKLPN